MFRYLSALFSTLLFTSLSASEELRLSNVRQLTYSEMGFEKAGEAYFSPDDRKIIFQAVPLGESDYQMYVMDLEEKTPRMVSTGLGACTCGYFHPGGEKIIFGSSHESPITEMKEVERKGNYKWNLTPYMNIYEANIDGTDLKALTFGSAYHAECAYSPDGKEIVYASNEDGTMNLYRMQSDGTDVRQLTKNCDCYNGGPFFSPDGQKILFRADRDKRDYLQIYTIDKEGNNETQLTHNESVNWAPYWHPDNKHIVFTKSVNNHRAYQIFLLDTETGEEQCLTCQSSFNGLPVFNQSGTKIMWTSKRGEDQTCQIFLADFN